MVTISFTPAVSADFAIGAQLVTSPANGKINFSISTGSTTIAALGPNGQPGDVDDSSTLTQESYVPLGGAHLIAGTSYTLVGRVDAAGGSGGYFAGIDYLTIAPISNLTAAPDNVGISADGTSSGANLDASTPAMSLSQQALAAQGYLPGGLFTAADGVTFPVPGAAAGGYDNMLASGDQYVFASTPAVMQEVDLLVAATGTATPQNDAGYVVTMNYGQDDMAFFEHAQLPSVPNWQAAADNSTAGVPDPTGTMSTTREPGLSPAYYNSGSAPVTR